ncbi:MAG TPA: hypothetical protein EYG85_13030 [Crocinitomix sp.]|nr:hypothetical protein [Crocinitomix sp.]
MFKHVFISLFVLTVGVSIAQSDRFRAAFEIGVMGGGSYYIGDLNPNTHFKYSDWAAGLIVRYNLSNRHSFRFTASYANVYGDDAMSNDPYQINRNLSFYTDIIEIAAGFEIDLLKYRINDMKYPITPYFFYEIAYFRMNPKVKDEFGDEISLQELGTEGQGTILNSKKQYGLNQISIPLGIGLKFNLKERLAISIEYGIRKTFTDYLDDVSGKYVNPLALQGIKGPLTAQLADQSLNQQSYFTEGLDRGNPRTKDWYSMYGLMITFKPWGKTKCHFQPR